MGMGGRLKSETPKLTRAFDATCRKGPRRLFGRSLLAADLLLYMSHKL